MTIEGLGKKFQDARLARGLTLDEAARLTKIRPSRLAEIEADDFSQFPSLAYAKGFLQIYGRFLDVDVTPYLDAFETSRDVTVDGYSYLQDQPAPKPRRVRPSRPAAVRTPRPRSDRRSSPFPVLIAVGVIIVGFVLMRLILNIQRIAPHQMVGVPQPSAAESAPPQAAVQQAPPPQAPVRQPPAQTPAPSVAPVAQAPSRAPSQASVAVVEATKKPSVTTPAPSIQIPEAVVPAFANANVPAKTSAVTEATKKPAPPVSTPAVPVGPQFANPSPSGPRSTAVAAKEPEVRRAEPVRPEDLAKAAATQTKSESQVPNSIAIKPLKKTYIKVVIDDGSSQPAFERCISPADGPVEFRGHNFEVPILDRHDNRITKIVKALSVDY